MQNNSDIQKDLYGFTIFFDSLCSESLNLEGKLIITIDEEIGTQIISKEDCKVEHALTLISQSIKLQQTLYFSKKMQRYNDSSDIQASFYVNDVDYSQPVFIGLININLTKVINSHSQDQEIDIKLQNCDYKNTSVKVLVSARKDLQTSLIQQTGKQNRGNYINRQAQRFQMLNKDMADDSLTKYDQDDLYIRETAAQDYGQTRETLISDTDTQSIRNKIIFEDETSECRESNDTDNFDHLRQQCYKGVHTPLKGDQDTINITQTLDNIQTSRYENSYTNEYSKISILNFDQIEQQKSSKNPKPNHSPEIHHILSTYEQKLSNFLDQKDPSPTKTHSCTKTPSDPSLESLKRAYFSVCGQNDKLKNELKMLKLAHQRLYNKTSNREISELKQDIASLTAEISSLIGYKSRFEQLKKENQKLVEIEEKYEDQVEKLQEKIEEVQFVHSGKDSKDQVKIQEYCQRIKDLEDIVKQKDIKLEEISIDRNISTLSKQNESLTKKLEQVNKALATQQASTVSLKRHNSIVNKLEDELRQKQRDIEEYEQTIDMYNKSKYEQNSEERGSQLQRNESGSEAVSDEGEIHDARHLSMEVIETQHRLERLEFYERNNLELLEELEQKDLEYHLSIKHHKEELNSLKNYFQEQLTTLESSHELKISQIKLSERKSASLDQEQLQDEFQSMFSAKFNEWKSQAKQYEDKIKHLENMINSS
ncbi:unnamed protein product [Moneuplotes crassus]|uniref:C2 NT-type domain-containing protein n=1 Tax=Euplotes crassus TaxID=5936 RepID=A0AAD1U0L8_EUPCR|nr:unnamed protein product [Moneuplotes crassus]